MPIHSEDEAIEVFQHRELGTANAVADGARLVMPRIGSASGSRLGCFTFECNG